jgi:tol-pal system protein YbgF
MRQRLLATIIFATLPFAAGFAYVKSASAQDGGDYARVSQIEQQVRELTNQLEQRDFQIRQLNDAFKKFEADTATRLQDLESKISGGAPAPAPQGFETPAAPDAPNTTMPDTNTIVPPQPNAVSNGAQLDPNGAFKPSQNVNQLGQITEKNTDNGGALTSGRPQGALSAAQAYDQAFSNLQNNNYGEAQKAFTEFLKTYASHPLAANAQFWLGETHFAQNQFPAAAKVFAKAFQEHPQGQKASDSLLKLALTLEKLNKKEDACVTLQELAKRFTKGPASVIKRGAEESQRMGCKK